LRIRFSDRAIAEIEEIRAWLTDDDSATAERIVARIRQTIAMFEMFPMLGHDGEVEGTREFKVTGLPYLIVYKIATATDLVIISILHSRRNYP
jgi:toxin ParE1/3/4